MNIVDYTSKFQEIEEKFSLFEYEDENKLKYWDIVRHDVFYCIYHCISGGTMPIIFATYNSKKSSINILLNELKNISKFYSLTFFRKYKYLLFATSRYKNEVGINHDIASNDVIELIKNDTLIVETYRQSGSYLYPYVFNSGLRIRKFELSIKKRFFKTHNTNTNEIETILNREFDINIDLNDLINTLIEQYYIEYHYYNKFFKRLMPSSIFVVQNGIQKGMFAAANNLKIPLIELQHGLIGYIHPAYSYPKSITLNQLKTLPSYFMSFSTFWTKNLNYPMQRIIPIGNSSYAYRVPKYQKIYDITFIFADIYTEFLIQLIDELMLNKFDGNICIKLHPNQFYQYQEIEKHFVDFKLITIIRNENSIESLFSISKSILAIQSTCVYQAIYNDVMVLIYKKMDYQTHADVFENKLVRLVETADDVINELGKTIQKSNNSEIYFEDFKKDVFADFLSSIK